MSARDDLRAAVARANEALEGDSSDAERDALLVLVEAAEAVLAPPKSRTALTGRPEDQLPGQTDLVDTIRDVQAQGPVRADAVGVVEPRPEERARREALRKTTQQRAKEKAVARAGDLYSDRLADRAEARERALARDRRERASRYRTAKAAVARKIKDKDSK